MLCSDKVEQVREDFLWVVRNVMRLPRACVIWAAVLLTALVTFGIGKPQSDSGSSDGAIRQDAVLTAGTADVPPLGRLVPAPLGPIPCLDGSTVEFGQFCPLPTINCANGTKVFVGQWCPVGPTPEQAPPPASQPQPTPTAQPLPTPTALPLPTPTAQPLPTPTAQPLPTPQPQRCQELGTC